MPSIDMDRRSIEMRGVIDDLCPRLDSPTTQKKENKEDFIPGKPATLEDILLNGDPTCDRFCREFVGFVMRLMKKGITNTLTIYISFPVMIDEVLAKEEWKTFALAQGYIKHKPQPEQYKLGDEFNTEGSRTFRLTRVGSNLIALICVNQPEYYFGEPLRVSYPTTITKRDFDQLRGNVTLFRSPRV